jgi:hypothetical protein
MSEAKKRKVHTAEFKAKVGLEALRGVSSAPSRLNFLFSPSITLASAMHSSYTKAHGNGQLFIYDS